MAQGSRQVQTQARATADTNAVAATNSGGKAAGTSRRGTRGTAYAELLENPALEEGKEDTPGDEYPDTPDAETGSEDGGDTSYDSLSDYLNEDDIPDYKLQENNRSKGSRQKKFLSPTPPPSMKPCASSSASRT